MARLRIAQHVVEVLVPHGAYDPATPTGAGISQSVVEVLGTFPSAMRISQFVVEVLVSDGDTGAEGGGDPGSTSGVRVFGYAG